MEMIYYCTDKSKEKIMKMVFNFARVSNYLLIFTFMSSRRFINEEFMERLSKNYGVINQIEGEKFLNQLDDLTNKIDTYEKMFEYIGLPELNDQKDITKNFFRSVIMSNRQKYSNIFLFIAPEDPKL